MLGNPRHSWILDSTPWIPDSIYWIPDLFQWNLDSGFELLVGFRIPTPVFRIPRPRIPDSTSKNFQDSGFQMQKFPGFRNPDSFTWGDKLMPFAWPFAIKKGRFKLSTPAKCTSHVKLSKGGQSTNIKKS